MTRFPAVRAGLLTATALGATFTFGTPRAHASTDQRIDAIERQIRALQGELHKVKADLAQRNAELRARSERERAAAPRTAAVMSPGTKIPVYMGPGQGMVMVSPSYTTPAGSPYLNVFGVPHRSYAASGLGTFQIGEVSVTLGGYVDLAAIYRSRNESLDNASDFGNGIPYPNAVNYHQSEFRMSGRSSRLGILAQDNITPVTNLAAYYEMDFVSAGTSSNARETNSYTLRLRNAYGTYERKDYDLKILAGQSWSLATATRVGISERLENAPLAIDQALVVGFAYTRQAQLRIVKGFDKSKYHLALSFEEPQTVYYVGPNGAAPAAVGTVTNSFPGIGTNNSTYNYSNEIAPDIILKGAADPGWGHYELFGLMEFERNRVSHVGSGSNNTVLAGGGGGSFILPIVKGKLDFMGNALVGTGIGRYGPALMADATIDSSGKPKPLPEFMGLAGVVYHPAKPWDIYAYFGTERILHREDFDAAGKGYGYGNPLYSNAGCLTELSTLACIGNTKNITEGTIGLWYRPLRGPFGTLQNGIQYAYIKRDAFSGIGGAPHSDISIVMMSFRYLPFQ
jgi:hypothetical protein